MPTYADGKTQVELHGKAVAWRKTCSQCQAYPLVLISQWLYQAIVYLLANLAENVAIQKVFGSGFSIDHTDSTIAPKRRFASTLVNRLLTDIWFARQKSLKCQQK